MPFLDSYPIGKRTVSLSEAEEIVGVSRRTLYNWIEADRVDYLRTAGGSIRIVEETLWRTSNESAQPHAKTN